MTKKIDFLCKKRLFFFKLIYLWLSPKSFDDRGRAGSDWRSTSGLETVSDSKSSRRDVGRWRRIARNRCFRSTSKCARLLLLLLLRSRRIECTESQRRQLRSPICCYPTADKDCLSPTGHQRLPSLQIVPIWMDFKEISHHNWEIWN